MDLQTAHALAIVARLVKASPDRRVVKAFKHLRHQLAEPQGDTAPAVQTSCENYPTSRAADIKQDNDPWQADDSMLSDDVLESAIAAGNGAATGDRLMNCPPAVPLPRQAQIVDEAISAARGVGLSLPATVRIEWREGKNDITSGCVIADAAGTITMFLSVNVFPDTLRELAYHELMHVHDAASGTARTRLELERRAIAFAAQMMGSQ